MRMPEFYIYSTKLKLRSFAEMACLYGKMAWAR